jgi:hypothetical protein
MSTPQDDTPAKTAFDFPLFERIAVAARGVGTLLATPQGSPLGLKLASLLNDYVDEQFPEKAGKFNQDFSAARKEARDRAAAAQKAKDDAQYHKIWRDDIHFWALNHPAGQDDTAYLEGIAAKLPCVTCRQNWLAALKSAPPDFSTPEATFTWTVARHNEVNRRNGKREYTVEEARALYVAAG